ncbi:HPr family phosphocarrier protein [Petroclostridium sp. X23]|uniref:HPr family phosphocarrier protein n=1 Tax=Petroclostridium sp. X23 TaxID=3045146 RepID=UPI0024ADE306|nr:HPr family phosphocarrier protein [Petroclostridium sp. X23]WHH60522.1 HPr family phosphocarrier protein [Petroclostridium sp. X23]
MLSVTLLVNNDVGLHARPANNLVKEASKFKSEITITKNNSVKSAKNILNVLSLSVAKGDHITITANGPDEKEAIQALKKLSDNNFGA